MKKNKAVLFIVGVLTLSFVTCKTLDMQPKTDTSRIKDIPDRELPSLEELAVEELNANIHIAPQIVFVEKPMYIPEKDALPDDSRPVVSGVDSVQQSTAAGTVSPENYSHAARVYDYHHDQVFEIYTQILRTTDIYLEPGEFAVELPFISDSERWIVGAGINQQNGQLIQHIYIKPKESGLEASMIINTDRRVYHILLRSYSTVYMPIVRWDYQNKGFPLNFASPGMLPQAANIANGITPQGVSLTEDIEYVDPRFLSFDYKIKFNVFRRPSWMPRLIYDDGKKTYIVFDESALQMELPGIFENKRDIINYRVDGDLVIIDKLIETITVTYKKQKITITKKKEN
ncbi:hypothetical protein FACS189485_15810 [Spirochaetia bacterium]|nr:hypothetical protein FACS189485_15810 [Spirochaetia bacterium]